VEINPLRKPVIRLIRRRVEAAARRRIQSNAELWPLLKEYLAKTESTGCQYSDYDVLYREIRRLKPHEVLECGTGVSTVVIAQALRENARETGVAGRVTSMEDIERWFEMAVRLLPDALKDFVDLRLSAKVDDGYSIFRGVRYSSVPDRPYEFVFVDGPGTRGAEGTRCFDFDFIHLVRHTDRPVAAVVDGRLTTCYVLQHLFGSDKVRFNVYENLARVGPVSRRDLRVLDSLKHNMRLVTHPMFTLTWHPPTPDDLSDRSSRGDSE
jgi:hypothetical protein